MVAAVGPDPRLAAAACEVVRRRYDQRERQLPRSTCARATPQQGGADLGRRARRSPHAHVLRAVSSGVDVRKCPQIAWRSKRRSRGDLPAAHSRARHLDACMRANRRRAQRGVRRLQRRVAARSHQRLGLPSVDHRRWQPSTRTDRAAQAGGRRSSGRDAVDRACRRGPARSRHPSRTHGRARLLVSRADARRLVQMRSGADGFRGHAVHPLYLWHHWETEGHRPHHRRTTSTGARPISAG